MHHSGFITDDKNNKKKLFQWINKLLGKEKRFLPHSYTDIQLADDFSRFFTSKITKIRSGIEAERSGDESIINNNCNGCCFRNDQLS